VAQAVSDCLAREAAAGRWPMLSVESVDGRPAADSPLAPALRGAGFVATPAGFLWKPAR
jgi:hypothetical protein